MAMTKCRECGREVSDQAAACPGCGAPIAPREVSATAKRYKGHMVGAGVLFCAGLVGLVTVPPLGIAATAGGLLWMIYAKAAAWWRNG